MASRAPFRADEVGSLLRPAELKEARAARAEGRIGDAELRAIEDRMVRDVVAKQEAVGLKAVTDGEFRRSWWHFDFLGALDGVNVVEADHGIQFQGVQTKAQTLKINGKVGFPADHPMLEHFRFLKSVAKVTPKMTIPAPSVLHFRGGRQAIDKNVYPTMEAFYADTAAAYRNAVRLSTRLAAATFNSMTRSGPISARKRSVRACAIAAKILMRFQRFTAT